MALSRGIFIVASKRTPFGTFGGKLAKYTSTDLQEIACRAALDAGAVKPETVDSIIVGNVIQSSTDAAYLARHVGLRVGLRMEIPALTVNRLCGSGFQSIVNAAHEMMVGDSEIVMTGGSENMSQAPYAVRDIRFGIRLGLEPKMEDTLWAGLTDMHTKTPMGVTAENLAVKYELTREMCDQFACTTQTRWQEANAAGHYQAEMAPITLKSKKGPQVMDTDEHPREVTLEALAKLPPVFKKNGTVTAGNASGICDGASAVILATEEAVARHDLTPLARLVGYGVSGCDPNIMGIGPVPAIRKMLKATNTTLESADLVEVNEAFAPQVLAVQKELNIDPAKLNVCGGAIALGHPLGASGSRITAHLVHQLQQKDVKHAIGSACIGGGQGIAVLLERV